MSLKKGEAKIDNRSPNRNFPNRGQDQFVTSYAAQFCVSVRTKTNIISVETDVK